MDISFIQTKIGQTGQEQRAMQPLIHFSTRKVGGIRFVKIGRLSFSFCLAKSAKPIKSARPRARANNPERKMREFLARYQTTGA